VASFRFLRWGGTWFSVAVLALVVFLVYRFWPTPPNVPSEQRQQPSQENGFRDVAAESGLNFHMSFLPGEQGENFKINLYDHGCGVAVGDYDNDGKDDVYFLNQLSANALFHNKGDGTFEDVTERMRVGLADRICVAGAFADYDNDGDQDLFVVSTRGGNVLFRNDNDYFQDVTAEAGLTHVGHSQSAVFFDYDRDSLLDLYVLQTAEWTTEVFDAQQRYYLGRGDLGGIADSPVEHNILYKNQGNGTFVDVTESAKLASRGWSSDASVFDYDNDGWLDLLVVCMFGPAQLYHNQQNGEFADVTKQVLGRTPYGGVGSKAFDSDNNGLLDLYVVDMHSDMWMGVDYSHDSLRQAQLSQKQRFDYFYGPYVPASAELQEKEKRIEAAHGFDHSEVVFGNAFYQNLGDGRFEEVSQRQNLETFWPWGVADGDFDNDGFVDVFIPSGMGYPYYYWRNQLLMNKDGNEFAELSGELGIDPPREGRFLQEKIKRMDCPRSSRSAVAADFDDDGRLDIVVNNFNDRPYLYANHLLPGNYVAFRLRGTQSNRDAIGAVVRLYSGNEVLTRQVPAAGGYLANSSKKLHFGLGSRAIERAEVDWPNGARQTIADLKLNSTLEIVEPPATATSDPASNRF
jgi:hypothetical protein